MQSQITVGKHGVTSFDGPDAVELFRVITLRSAIGLMSKGIKPTRGASMTKLLAMATQYTGQRYKRSEYERAMQDLTVWAETMKSAIPVVRA